MKTKPAIAALSLGLVPVVCGQTTQNYPDPTGEVAVGTFPHIDIAAVDVTVDATETGITFKITLDGDPVVDNWGNYMIGIRSAGTGTATGNPWGRPINFAPGMTHWIGCWVSTGGDGQIWSYSGSWSQTGSLNGTDGTVTVDGTGKFVEITTAVANLGLDPGETFAFDVYTSGGGGGDSAVDALSASTASVANWGDTFTTNVVGGTPNPARAFTMPGVATDNDADGLPNTAETNTGTYVSPSNTGTDPDDPDTDDDLLGDGDEVNTHGTNPNLADTDADGANDATEISLGSNALAGPIPSGGDLQVVGFDFFDYPDGGIDGATGFETRVFDFDNSTGNDAFLGHTGAVTAWSTTFGTRVDCGRLLTENSNAIRQFNGAATGGTALGRVENVAGIDAKVVYAKIDLTRLSGATFSGLSFVNGTTEVAFAGVRGALNGSDRNFGVEVTGEAGAAFTGDIPADRVTDTIVARLDTTGTPTIAIWVNPDTSTASAPAPDAFAEFATASNAVATGIRIASGGRAFWDNLVVSTTWDDLDDATPTNTDSDGLRDSWEELFAPGSLATLSGAGNNDADTLTNAAEQTSGTNPLNGDTDDDLLTDDVETNTGVFVSSSNTGTDPCDADTDDDNLRDAVESGTGTFVSPEITGSNPNVADTDNDGENDGFEVFQGTDPTDNTKSSFLLGLVKVNGTRDAGDGYGAPLAVQTVQTQFGDNGSELNAAYARVQDGKLYLLITGNLENNFNKLELFIDSADTFASEVFASALNDGAEVMDGMTFDNGFTPDYHLILRRGTDGGNDKFDVDFADLDAGSASQYFDILSFGTTGYGSTATGVNASPIRAAYDGSNTAGVTGGTAAADQAAAAAVTTGLELCIDLADLGNPTTAIRMMAAVNNGGHTYLSNQILGGLPAPQGNLGGDGAGNFTGDLSAIDFNDFAGDQFFTLSLLGTPTIAGVELINGGTQLQITVEGLTDGASYVLRESADLTGFGAVTTAVSPGASFTASGTTQVLTITRPAGDRRFYRIEDAP